MIGLSFRESFLHRMLIEFLSINESLKIFHYMVFHVATSLSPYSWDSEDSKIMESADFILAADCK